MKIFALLGLAGSLCSAAASAAPLEAQQLIALKRLTVGPYDNYQSAVDKDETFLYYTRSQNLSSQLMRLDLKSGVASELTPPDGDAQSPALSPDGKTLAFTYFREDAKGDICILKGGDISCLTKAGRVEHSPFWIDDQSLAYIASNDAGTQNTLFIYNLDSKKTDQITEGQIYAPSLSPDAQTLVYKAKSNDLVLFDLRSKKVVQTLTMKLPGVTGPARFSNDGAYLYFAQYMVDSNQDLLLDGRDAAAIFRISLQNPQLPEQLTSLEQNCSYPFPGVNSLYITCAFEGALDIYRSPLEGTVPKSWVQADLWDAHQSARSYSDRILFLNHLYTRFKAFAETDFNERSLANFLFMNAYLPASFYAGKLKDTPSYPNAAIEQILLDTYARWEVLPQKRNLGQFADYLQKQGKNLKSLPSGALSEVAQSYFSFFANDAQSALKSIKSLTSEDPRVLYWKTKLERLILREKDPKEYRLELAARSLAPSLSLQTKLYYLSLWLDERPREQDPLTLVSDFGGRLESVPQLKELIDNEHELFELAKSQTPEQRIEFTRAIVKRIERLANDYFPLRLLFNRAMIVLSEAKRTKEMADIVSLWMSYLKRGSKEYPYALESMRRNLSDIAYRFLANKPPEKTLASGSFYGSIRTADDLESHYMYTALNQDPAAWAQLEKTYKIMVKDGLIRPKSVDFVRTVHSLLAGKTKAEDWEKAADVFNGLSDEYVGLGMKYLLLGYSYQQQLVLTQKGWTYDRDLAEQAHRSYLFAIDASFGNDRILAAALQNLALLHTHLRNYTLAAEFYVKRDELPFASDAQRLAYLWLKARVMYLSYKPLDALAAIEKALSLKPEPRPPFLEKAGFYAAYAQQFPKAVSYYKEFLQGGASSSAQYLAYGYALRGAAQPVEAEKAFLEAITRSAKEKGPGSKVEAPALVVQPEKNQFIALGLLARTEGLPLEKRREYLKKRLGQFASIRKSAKLYHFQDEALSDQEVKETQDLALLEAQLKKDGPEAVQSLEKSLALTEKHGEEFGYLSATILTSLKNAMIFSREQQRSSPALDKAIATLTASVDGAYKELNNPGALVTQKWGELRLVTAAYRLRQDGGRKEKLASTTQALLAEEVFQNLAKDKPDLVASLKTYSEGLQRLF